MNWLLAGTRGSLLNHFVEELITIMNFIEDFEPSSGLRSPKAAANETCSNRKAKIAYAKASATDGGERGIRTPGPFGSTVFKTAALDRSAISPAQK